jgi:hypothetical protein
MIKLKRLIENVEWPTTSPNEKIWYHGRTVDSESFSYDYVGGENAHDQEGPGFYFTSNLNDARSYAQHNGIILKCEIDYKKLIIKSDTSSTKTNKKVLVDLINNSPNKEYTLSNFDENPRIAMINAVNAYLRYEDAFDSYQILARDFYRYEAKEYLETLSKYYDAQLTTKEGSMDGHRLYHLIVYKPSIIKVLDKMKYE